MVFFPEPLQPTTVPCTVGRFLPCRQSSGSNGRGIKVLFISVFVAHLAVPCCPLPTFLAFIPLRDLLSSKFTITKNAMKAMTSKPIKIICFSLKISPPIHKRFLESRNSRRLYCCTSCLSLFLSIILKRRVFISKCSRYSSETTQRPPFSSEIME